MKSVTEKGLGILLRQGYGGQEKGGVRGGEKDLSSKGLFPRPNSLNLFTDLYREQRLYFSQALLPRMPSAKKTGA